MSRPLLLFGGSLPIPRAPLLRCMFEGRDRKILLRCIPPHTLATWLPPFSWSKRCSQTALSFGPSASLRPDLCAASPFGPSALLILSPGMVVRDVALRTFRFAPSLPLRYACGPRPLTAAGGQGPQDNTLTPCNFNPSLPLRYACGPRFTAACGQGPQDNTRLRPLHFRSIPLAGRTVHNGRQVS